MYLFLLLFPVIFLRLLLLPLLLLCGQIVPYRLFRQGIQFGCQHVVRRSGWVGAFAAGTASGAGVVDATSHERSVSIGKILPPHPVQVWAGGHVEHRHDTVGKRALKGKPRERDPTKDVRKQFKN